MQMDRTQPQTQTLAGDIEMTNEVRNHLENKLRNAIGKETRDYRLCVALLACCCCADLHSKFKTLLNLLEPNNNESRLSLPNLYLLDNLLRDWQSKKGSYSIDALTFVLKFSSSLAKIIKTPGSVDSGQAPAPVSAADTGDQRWSDRSVNQKEIVGFDERAMSLGRLLIQKEDDSQFQAIGLVGLQGIGKTTLCKMTFNGPELNKYVPRIWVCLTRLPNDDLDPRKETVKRILVCLGVERRIIVSAHRSHGLQGLLFMLRLQLAGKNYLIVLDDVWCREDKDEHNKLDLAFYKSLAENETNCSEKLAYGLPKGDGGTVLFTSRIGEVAERMAPAENLHRVRPLSEVNCWEIFKATVERDGQKLPEDLNRLKDRITKRCAGLPLAAKLLGEIARQNAARQLENQAAGDHQDDRVNGN